MPIYDDSGSKVSLECLVGFLVNHIHVANKESHTCNAYTSFATFATFAIILSN